MNSKIAKQIASLVHKLSDEDKLSLRDEIIRRCREQDIEVTAGEECPPSDPDCDPPENPPPGP